MLDPLDLDAVNVDQPRGIFVPSICDWAQDSTSVTLFFPLGPAIRARDVQVQIKAAHLQVLQRVAAAQGGGNRVILAGPLFARCDPTESEWELEIESNASCGLAGPCTLTSTILRSLLQPKGNATRTLLSEDFDAFTMPHAKSEEFIGRHRCPAPSLRAL